MPRQIGHETVKSRPFGTIFHQIKRTGRLERPDETGVNTPSEKRRYVITADRFKCSDESGIDWTGSDEVKWAFTTKLTEEETVTSVTPEFGNIDSGDERVFKSDEGKIAPAKGTSGTGVAAPVGVSIQLVEIDQGTDIESGVKRAFDVMGFVPGVGQWVAKTPDVVKSHIAKALEDDLMGSNTIVFRAHDLERRLPVIGSDFVDRLYFGGQGGDLPFAVAGGPDYYLYLKVTRVDDAE